MKRTLALTTPHMTGDDVKYAQRLLAGKGYYTATLDEEFGPLAAQASYRAQFWFGYANPSQTFGTNLEKLLKGITAPTGDALKRIEQRKKKATENPLQLAALEKMKTFVGLVEDPPGSNNVPLINGWWGGGNAPWCARTVSKAYSDAGSKRFNRGRAYEYVPTLVGDARAGRNGLTVTLDPKPGDLVCYDWDGSDFHGDKNHVGMFVSGTRDAFRTIEGNISSRCDYHDRKQADAKRIVFVHVGG